MEPRALLVFAVSSYTDCKRRGWPTALRTLLETQSFRFEKSAGIDVHLFTSPSSLSPARLPSNVHAQEGASFGQRLENAVEALAQLGYQEIVIVGQDCPDLEPADIRRAFELLGDHRIVLGPDHRGGCYLIGLRGADRARLKGVRWQRNTDFRQICRRFPEESPVELPVKIDLDTWEDVWLLAASQSSFRWMARALLDLHAGFAGLESARTELQLREERIHWQLPPPLLA